MPFIIALFVVFIIVSIVMGGIAAKRRREALGALAVRLGLRFSPEKDYGMDDRYRFLDALRQGSNHYAFNILSGNYEGYEILVFDYHYETHSTDSKGRRQTHHHYFSFFILTLEISCPELTITKEGFMSKIAQSLGFDDIDFESHEFSRRFCVRSKDKKFAYDVCNGKMIDHLLGNRDLSIEIEGSAMALSFNRRLDAPQIEYNLSRLLEIRQLMPEYLFANK